MTKLLARGLDVVVGLRTLVHDFDLELGTDRRVALLGPSGCGKSTVARALVGLERIRGSLRFDGVELCDAGRSAWVPVRRRVQLCWQEPRRALDPQLVVERLLDEARVLSGRPPLDPRSREALLQRVGLEPKCAGRRPVELSGGQRTRVGLARALAAEPEILVADEVTAGVDRPLASQLVELCEARAGGLLWIGHDLDLLPSELDEIVIMDAGRVVERTTPARLGTRSEHAVTRALVRAAEARRFDR